MVYLARKGNDEQNTGKDAVRIQARRRQIALAGRFHEMYLLAEKDGTPRTDTPERALQMRECATAWE